MKFNDLHPYTYLAPRKVSPYLNNVALVTAKNDRYISEICQEANTNNLQQPSVLPQLVKFNSGILFATGVVWTWIVNWLEPLQKKQNSLQKQHKHLTSGETCGCLC
jgi:hypothetical protein